MTGQLITEAEARRLVFQKESRPSLPAWQRMRRELQLPHLRLNRRVFYNLNELQTHLDKMKRPAPSS